MEESQNPASQPPWWQMGNLHHQTLEDWRVAEQENRLSTALDMLVAIQEDLGAAIEFHEYESLMRYVLETVGCLDAIASQVPDPQQIPVSQAMLVAARALGYLPPAAEQTSAQGVH